jgi:hypothetical protein
MQDNSEKKISSTQKYLVTLYTEQLCFKLVDVMFTDQRDRIIKNPSLAPSVFAITSNFLEMASDIEGYSDARYDAYVRSKLWQLYYKGAGPMGFQGSNFADMRVYKYAIELREIFKGNEDLLKKDFGLERYGALPPLNEIRELLQPKFHQLATTFREKFNEGTVPINNINEFMENNNIQIKGKIANAISSLDYLF